MATLCMAPPPAQDRSAQSSHEWRAQIQAVDASVKEHLRTKIVGGFDEERFGGQIGFANLRRSVCDSPCTVWLLCVITSRCRYLEDELAQRYKDATPAILAVLQARGKNAWL